MVGNEPATGAAEANGAAPPDAKASVSDGVVRSLDPRAILLGRQVGWIVTASIAVPSFVALVVTLLVRPFPGWAMAASALAWAAVTGGLGWWLHRWPEVEHRHASYKVDEHGIEIREGVIWRRVINVPRSRVQHTDVSQGPFERGHGLGTISIYTAGTDHARVNLGGLDHATALAIRDQLLPREGSDAV